MNKVSIFAYMKQFIQQSPDEQIKKIAFLLVVILMMFMVNRFLPMSTTTQTEHRDKTSDVQPFYTLETYYETRLKEALSVFGDGTVVDVLINFDGTEITHYLMNMDVTYSETRTSTQVDSQDKQSTKNDKSTVVMEEKDRHRSPVEFETMKPKEQGVLIVIEGLYSNALKKSYTDIASKYLSVSPHRVAVQFKGGKSK